MRVARGCALKYWRGVTPRKRRQAAAHQMYLRCLCANPAGEDWLVRIDAAVAQERPVAPLVFAFCWIAFDYENLFFAVAGFGNHLSVRRGYKGVSPEFQTGVARVRLALKTHTIYRRRINSIGDGV